MSRARDAVQALAIALHSDVRLTALDVGTRLVAVVARGVRRASDDGAA